MWGGCRRVVAAIARRATTLALPTLYTLCATCSVADADRRRTRFENSTFLTRGTTYAEGSLVWSPVTGLDALGTHLRVSSAIGTWRERTFDIDVPKNHLAVAIGQRFSVGPIRTTIELGVHRVDEAGWVRRRRAGPTGRIILLWSDPGAAFVHLDLRANGAERVVSASIASGVPLAWGLKLGPEAGVSIGHSGTAWRIGAALSGVRLFGQDMAVSGGWHRDERGTSGIYGSLWTARRF